MNPLSPAGAENLSPAEMSVGHEAGYLGIVTRILDSPFATTQLLRGDPDISSVSSDATPEFVNQREDGQDGSSEISDGEETQMPPNLESRKNGLVESGNESPEENLENHLRLSTSVTSKSRNRRQLHPPRHRRHTESDSSSTSESTQVVEDRSAEDTAHQKRRHNIATSARQLAHHIRNMSLSGSSSEVNKTGEPNQQGDSVPHQQGNPLPRQQENPITLQQHESMPDQQGNPVPHQHSDVAGLSASPLPRQHDDVAAKSASPPSRKLRNPNGGTNLQEQTAEIAGHHRPADLALKKWDLPGGLHSHPGPPALVIFIVCFFAALFLSTVFLVSNFVIFPAPTVPFIVVDKNSRRPPPTPRREGLNSTLAPEWGTRRRPQLSIRIPGQESGDEVGTRSEVGPTVEKKEEVGVQRSVRKKGSIKKREDNFVEIGLNTPKAMLDLWTGLRSPWGTASLGQSAPVTPVAMLHVFSFRDVKLATGNFSRFLGRDISNRTCRAYFSGPPPYEAAVKFLGKSSVLGEQEFQNEIAFLGRVHHPNLLPILGYCSEKYHKMILYDFARKGSLRSNLAIESEESIKWSVRVKIIKSIASAMLYLHEEVNPPILHGNLKATNVFLTDEYEPKVSEFGLRRFKPDPVRGAKHRPSPSVIGNSDPQFLATDEYSESSDVYAFGVLVFEIVSGRSPEEGLMDYVSLANIGEDWSGRWRILADPKLEEKYDGEEFNKISSLANRCTKRVPSQRPKMADVVYELGAVGTFVEPDTGLTRSFTFTSSADVSEASSPYPLGQSMDDLFTGVERNRFVKGGGDASPPKRTVSEQPKRLRRGEEGSSST